MPQQISMTVAKDLLMMPLVSRSLSRECEADGWFVEHIHHAHQNRNRSESPKRVRCASPPDKVLAARDSVEIVQSDVVEESKTGTRSLQHLAGDPRGRPFKLQAVHPCEAYLSGHVAITSAMDSPPTVTASTSGPKPTALACLTRYFTHIRFRNTASSDRSRSRHTYASAYAPRLRNRWNIRAYDPNGLRYGPAPLEITPIHNGLTGLSRKIASKGVSRSKPSHRRAPQAHGDNIRRCLWSCPTVRWRSHSVSC